MNRHNRVFHTIYHPNKDKVQSLTKVFGPYVVYNNVTDNLLYFMPDPPHIVKKLRNNLYKSYNPSIKEKGRTLMYEGGQISWKTIQRAWERDQCRPIWCTKLRAQHIFLNARSKMSCRYANEIFTQKLINDIATCDFELSFAEREATLWYLSIGHLIKRVFSSTRGISDPDHADLVELLHVADKFETWVSNSEAAKDTIPSYQTSQDLIYAIRSFVSFVRYVLEDTVMHEYEVHEIVPANLNQNVVENHFSMQRRLGSQNTTPTIDQYRINKSHIDMMTMSKISSKASYENSHSVNVILPLQKTRRNSTNRLNAPSLAEISKEVLTLQPKLRGVMQNIVKWLNDEINDTVWLEDPIMSNTLLYCSGYMISNLLASFDNISNIAAFDLVGKLIYKTKRSDIQQLLHLARSEFLQFCRNVVIALRPFLKVDKIFQFKEKIFQVAVAAIRENQWIKQSWYNLILCRCWNIDKDTNITLSIFNRFTAKWIKLWLMDYFKKLDIVPVEGRLAHRVQVLLNGVDANKKRQLSFSITDLNQDDVGFSVDYDSMA